MLKVDPELQTVISHTAAKVSTFADLEAAAKHMKEQDVRRDSLFAQSVANEKNRAELMEKKFQEAIKKSKETPLDALKIREIDLD